MFNRATIGLVTTALLAGGLLLTAQTQAATWKKIAPRIIGGTNATAGDYPWIVSLRDGSGHFCGASLIAPQWVLSAAHCYDGSGPENLKVVVGEYHQGETSTSEEVINVAKVYPHANGEVHDIMLVKLAQPATIAPIAMATEAQTQALSAGDTLRVIGWGDTEEGAGKYPKILQQVDVPLYDFAACNAAYNNELDPKVNVCAGLVDGGKDSCQGDSGGPLFFQQDGQWRQLGVVSFGDGCGRAGKPGVYTRVASYLDWINTIRKGLILSGGDFGLIGANHSFVGQVSFDNETGADLVVQGANTASAGFEISDNQCDGKTLAHGQSCSIHLTASHSAEGPASGEIDVSTSHADGAQLTQALLASVIPETSFSGKFLTDSQQPSLWFAPSGQTWTHNTERSRLSQNIDSNLGSAMVMARFDQAAELSFRMKLADEDNYDYAFFINGKMEANNFAKYQSGQEFTYQVPKGATVMWAARMVEEPTSQLKDQTAFKLENLKYGSVGGDKGSGKGSMVGSLILFLGILFMGARVHRRSE